MGSYLTAICRWDRVTGDCCDQPGEIEYTYTAPRPGLPLTLLAKTLFLTESLVSLVTIGVVAARAVNILK